MLSFGRPVTKYAAHWACLRYGYPLRPLRCQLVHLGRLIEERVMKVFAISASVLVLLTGVALSQDGENANTIAEKLDVAAFRAKQEQKKQQELDAAYKAALKEKKVPATVVDPWGAVRPANNSNTVAK